MRAISILSGGMDSAVATALLMEEYEIHAITFNYGQRSARMEIEYSRRLSEHLGIEHRTLDLQWLGGLGGSVLTAGGRYHPHLTWMTPLSALRQQGRSGTREEPGIHIHRGLLRRGHEGQCSYCWLGSGGG